MSLSKISFLIAAKAEQNDHIRPEQIDHIKVTDFFYFYSGKNDSAKYGHSHWLFQQYD
jgi:hypothetical protein